MDISQFSTLVFDCDGVILDSNKVKTKAFYNVSLPYGVAAAENLVEYHVKHGGISRYKKFEYFLEEIVGTKVEQKSLDKLLRGYAIEVRKGLLSCEISFGLEKLRKAAQCKWMVVSGGDQEELRDIFAQRDLAQYFNGGIFGSPDSKKQIFSREIKNNNIIFPALFIGDSKYDHESANEFKIDFLFAYNWTDYSDWKVYCLDKEIDYISGIAEVVAD